MKGWTEIHEGTFEKDNRVLFTFLDKTTMVSCDLLGNLNQVRSFDCSIQDAAKRINKEDEITNEIIDEILAEDA